jgi:hypothetical protein
VTVDYLENQFASHDLCDKNQQRRVETLLTSVDDTPLGKVRERFVDKIIFQKNASGIFQDHHQYSWHIYLITAFECPIFQSLGSEKKL